MRVLVFLAFALLCASFMSAARRMGDWTVAVLLLTVVSAVNGAIVSDDGKVILTTDSCSEQDKLHVRVNATGCPGEQESYAGFVRVDAAKDINLFFWLCLANTEIKRRAAPVLLWLDGGPGVSSTVGALLQNGPYQLNEDGTVVERLHAWTNEFNMLYVDNPVGVGYSYSSKGIIHDRMEDVVENLYTLLKYLCCHAFPEYFKNGLYIGGASYAGKYIPNLGHYIHGKAEAECAIPLKGIYLGNALCDSAIMFPVYPDSLYHAGVYTKSSRETHRRQINDMIHNTIHNGGVLDVDEVYRVIFCTTHPYLSNLLAPEHTMKPETLKEFLNKPSTMKTLNVGGKKGDRQHEEVAVVNLRVQSAILRSDFIHGTRQHNRLLMDNYKVLQYSGNLDLKVTVAMTDEFLDQVEWVGRAQYRQTSYTRWKLSKDGELAGWYATVHNFTRVIVRNAGHNVPFDQPQFSLDMMKRFVHGQFDQRVPHDKRERNMCSTF